jgi:Zn-dependent protease with chaperone function
MIDSRSNPPDLLLLREQRFRRRLLFGLAMLLILAMSPLFGHHLPLVDEEALVGRDHVWALCMATLHVLLSPVHGVFHLLFLTGFGYALLDRGRAWRRQRAVLSLLSTRLPTRGSRLARAARAAGLDPVRIRVVDTLPSPAFTVGWLRPRVYVDACLESRLSGDELEAVLAHEAAHVRRRDPLRLSALRFLACTLFWLPSVRRLVEDLADEAEIIADDAAVRERPLALASALLALARWSGRPRSFGVGFGDRDMLERRIRRLAGEVVPPETRLTRRSVIAASLALMLAWSAGFVVAHPPPQSVEAHAEHCQHGGLAALLHLYCPGYNVHKSRADCPHR